jgi:hypothetical protein
MQVNTMNTEEKSDFFIQQLHDILLKDWDPKHIQKKSELEDEYDNFIEDILDILAEDNASKTQIADFLIFAETEALNLKANEQTAVLVAEKIWQAFENFIA